MEEGWIDRSGKFKYKTKMARFCFGFGKYMHRVARFSQSYLTWMIRGDFSPHVHAICRALIEGDPVPSPRPVARQGPW